MSLDAPLVSAIVPNYNYEKTLEMCLRALQAQTYAPMEIIVVDDCSTDASVAIARRLGVEVVRLSQNSGVSVARNAGAAHARGQVLFFVDSDVALEPDAVANAVQALGADCGVGAVCGIYHPIPLVRDSLVEEYRNFHQYYWLSLCEGTMRDIVHTAIMAVRAEVFTEIGGFSPRLRYVQGAEFAHRLFQRYEARLSLAVRGRHDNDDRMSVVLRKVFIRTRVQFSYFMRCRTASRVAGSSPAIGSLLAALAVVSTAVPVLLGPVWMALPGALLALSIAADGRMYRTAARERGVAFAAVFAAMHFPVNLTIAAAVATGVLQWLTSQRYRRLFDPVAGPDGGSPGRQARPGDDDAYAAAGENR